MPFPMPDVGESEALQSVFDEHPLQAGSGYAYPSSEVGSMSSSHRTSQNKIPKEWRLGDFWPL